MKYDIYVQNNFVKTIEVKSTGEALLIVAGEINSGSISIDQNKPHDIRIVPHNE